MPSRKLITQHVASGLMVGLVCGGPFTARLVGHSHTGDEGHRLVTVSLQVETTTGSQATLRARDGGRLTVSTGDGDSIALTPILVGDRLELRLTDLSVPGAERELTPVMLLRVVPSVLTGVPAITKVTWVGLAISDSTGTRKTQCGLPAGSPAATGAPPGPPQTDAPCSFCCVNCGGVLYCGCAVITSCGACCCPEECAC